MLSAVLYHDRADDTVLTAVPVLIDNVDIEERVRLAGGADLYLVPAPVREQDRGLGLSEALIDSMSGRLAETLDNLRVERFSRRAAVMYS